MAERIDKDYKRLFEVRLFHHYWLDEGDVVFDSLPKNETERALLTTDPKPPTQDQRLQSYDMRAFLSITPTATTTKALKGFGCIYKETASGCIVAVTGSVVLPSETMFEFVVTVKNAAFFNYTALTLRPQKIFEFFLQSEDPAPEDHPPEIKTYRYKENVPVLSNLTGASRTIGQNKIIFLSQEIPKLEENDLVESLVLEGNSLFQLTSDQPDAEKKKLNDKATDLPVFVNQADIPAIVPPQGLNGVPAKGIKLSDDMPDDVFALIQLSAKREGNSDFSIVDRTANTEEEYPVFQIRFKNRSTVWQYFNKKDMSAIRSEETEPLSLTYFGNAGKKQKPSEGLVEAKKNKSGDKITQLVSNIFI